MTHQVALTIIATIKPDETSDLKLLLSTMRADPGHNQLVPFSQFPAIHFARFMVLDASRDQAGTLVPPHLVFMGECDAPLDRLVRDLVEKAAPGLHRIFSHCEDYPADEKVTRAGLLAYLRAHMMKPQAFYVNTVGRTARQIRLEAQLRNALEAFLDQAHEELSTLTALEVRARIQAYVRGEPSLGWARRPAAGPGLFFRLGETLHMVGLPILLFILSPALILIFPVWALLLRLHELHDGAPRVRPDPAHLDALTALEDFVTQNQFTGVGYIKPGWFRRLTVAAVLLAVNYGTRHIYNRENLAGVKTIHFARWIAIDEYRRVIFASNYDGSMEGYNDDFINLVAWGLNAVFSNGVSYPRTKWLLFDGAKDEQAFKDFIRVFQIPTDVWYSAYDTLTAVNIANNAALRAGLFTPMGEAEAEAWLRLV